MAKLTKEQLKKLYDYGGTLSPKDWADMIDSLSPQEYDDSGTIIDTSYEDVKALYESGRMIPGVKYRCNINYNLTYDLYLNLQNVYIFIDKLGDLKLQHLGNANYNYDKSFIADFKFNGFLTNVDRTILESRKDISLSLYESNIEELINFLGNSFKYDYISLNDDIYTFNLHDCYTFVLDDVEYCVNKDRNRIIEIIRNEYNQIAATNIDIEFETLPCIYNVQYENGIFHCIFVEYNHLSDAAYIRCDMNIYGSSLDDYFMESLHMYSTGYIINTILHEADGYQFEEANIFKIMYNNSMILEQTM